MEKQPLSTSPADPADVTIPAPVRPAPVQNGEVQLQAFLERMTGAEKSHHVISQKRALRMSTKEPEALEPSESAAPLPVGSKVWFWPEFKELYFLIPGREPFKVANVLSYEIVHFDKLGLKIVQTKTGPVVVRHTPKAAEVSK